MPTSTGVGVLDKAMAIIDLCELRPMTGSDIARELDMAVPTAHRLAGALMTHGMLGRDDEGRFHMGSRLLGSRMAETARPVLARLTREIGETSQLWVARGEVRVCTASVVSDSELRVVLPVGSKLPLSAGGSAVPALRGEVGETGWVESVSQRTVGVGSVSAPVVVRNVPVAAVCVIAPLPRVSTTPGDMYGLQVVAAARDLATSLAS
jgi:DNA-binding IclR family transcriptional regulator